MEIILGIIMLVGVLNSVGSPQDDQQPDPVFPEQAVVGMAEPPQEMTPLQRQGAQPATLKECVAIRNAVIYRDLTVPYTDRHAPKPTASDHRE